MNLSGMDLSEFLTKLKGLIKRISRTHSSQITAHTQNCHSIITQLITDQNILTNLNSQQLRLLAYESVLFSVEMIKTRQDKQALRDSRKNKIETFLSSIYQTLALIKQLINNMESRVAGNTLIKNGTSSKSIINNNEFDRLHSNLHNYQQKIATIVSQFQHQNHINTTQVLNHENHQDQPNDLLIEQMHRIIQKKQHKIHQLTKSLHQLQQQQIHLQKTHQLTLTQHQQNHQALLKEIHELKIEKKEAIEYQEQSKKKFIIEQKYKIQNRLSIYETTNQRIIMNLPQYQNILFKYPIQTITQSTIRSAKSVPKMHLSPRKFSLQKDASNKSFRRIFSGDERDSISVNKKYSDLHQKNLSLYRLLLCQASTIEELI